MQRFNNTYTNTANDMSRLQMTRDTGDWGAEINGGGMNGMSMQDQMGRPMDTGAQMPETNAPAMHMNNHLSAEVVETPTTIQEAYEGSLKSYLNQNKGNFVAATFLVGTQGTVTFEGILFEVGNDYITIYQQGRDRYVVCDVYSLKYIEFYDMERRRICDRLMQEQGIELPNRFPNTAPIW